MPSRSGSTSFVCGCVTLIRRIRGWNRRSASSKPILSPRTPERSSAMFGKIMIFLHLGLSLMFATWALVLFTNRIDWTNKKGTATQSDGELLARMADYDRLAKSSVRPADARFREAREKVQKEE